MVVFSPSWPLSYCSLAIILVFASSCFILAVPMRKVYCVRYTPRAWDFRRVVMIHRAPEPLLQIIF